MYAQGLYISPVRSFPVSPQLAVRASSCSSDSNRMLENPSAASPMRNRLSLYVDYCRAFCALAKNFVLVMANSCSSDSNGTLEIRLLHSHAKQAFADMLIIAGRFVLLRKILLL